MYNCTEIYVDNIMFQKNNNDKNTLDKFDQLHSCTKVSAGIINNIIK